MNKVFIGGSRRAAHLSAMVQARLNKIMDNGLPVLVGDANGADKAVQQHLFSKNYQNVEVFCSGSVCRNNLGEWPTRHIETDARAKGFDFYAEKDRAMAHEAAFGFMLWDGKSKGTLLNVLRLVRQGKKVVIYRASERSFSELATYDQWESFISHYSVKLRNDTERRAALEERVASRRQQTSLFPVPPT